MPFCVCNQQRIRTNKQTNTEIIPQSAYSFALDITDDLQTLSTNSAPPGDLNQGLLYVPDLLYGDPCINASRPYIPANVTRQANLPPTNDYALIALAPWISPNCTLGYLTAARRDPARAFIFYLTNRDSDDEDPPPISDPAWSLQDGGSWKSANKYPVYAISSHRGSMLMHQLSAYSGNMTNVPYGHELTEIYQDSRDYARLYTEIRISRCSPSHFLIPKTRSNNHLQSLFPDTFWWLVGMLTLYYLRFWNISRSLGVPSHCAWGFDSGYHWRVPSHALDSASATPGP